MAANFARYGTPLDLSGQGTPLDDRPDFSGSGTALDLSAEGTPIEDTGFISGLDDFTRRITPDAVLSATEGFNRSASRLPANTLESTIGQAKQMAGGVGRGISDYMATHVAEHPHPTIGYDPATRAMLAGVDVTEPVDPAALRESAELGSEQFADLARRGQAQSQAASPKDAGTIERAIQSGVSSAAVSLPAVLLSREMGTKWVQRETSGLYGM